MTFTVSMTDQQQVSIGVTILDQDKQPLEALPAGASVSFVSSDPTIAKVTVRPDGMNADVNSEKIGTATITVSSIGLTPPLPSDTVTIRVVNSSPGSLNLTVGEPTEEPLP